MERISTVDLLVLTSLHHTENICFFYTMRRSTVRSLLFSKGSLAECCYARFRIFHIVMLSVIMLNGVMLNDIMLNGIMLNRIMPSLVMLSVSVPSKQSNNFFCMNFILLF
jgi:hypothetical protein